MKNKYLNSEDAKLAVKKWLEKPLMCDIPKNIRNCKTLLKAIATNPINYLRPFFQLIDAVRHVFNDIVELEYSLDYAFSRWELTIWNIRFACDQSRIDFCPYKLDNEHKHQIKLLFYRELQMMLELHNLNAGIYIYNIDFIPVDQLHLYIKQIHNPIIQKIKK